MHSDAENTGEKLDKMSLSPYGEARATVNDNPLSEEEVNLLTEYFHATLYLCLGMIYLRQNPLLRESLTVDHLKRRLLGHWQVILGLRSSCTFQRKPRIIPLVHLVRQKNETVYSFFWKSRNDATLFFLYKC